MRFCAITSRVGWLLYKYRYLILYFFSWSLFYAYTPRTIPVHFRDLMIYNDEILRYVFLSIRAWYSIIIILLIACYTHRYSLSLRFCAISADNNDWRAIAMLTDATAAAVYYLYYLHIVGPFGVVSYTVRSIKIHGYKKETKNVDKILYKSTGLQATQILSGGRNGRGSSSLHHHSPQA